MKRIVLVVMMLVVAGCGSRSTPGSSAATADSLPRPGVTAVDDSVLNTESTATPVETAPALARDQPDCDGGRVTFDYPPVDLERIEYVTPLGLMSGSHVTPVDHQYYQNFKEPDWDITVYSPAAGTITDIQHMQQTVSDGPGEPIDDYRLVIEHTCTISSIFIHVGQLSPRLSEVAPSAGGYARIDLPVEAGETIGSFRRNVDYNVIDLEVTLEGLLVPAHYEQESWKIHTPDPFDYFTGEIQEVLIAKSLRTVEPFGGRFAYDIDGRLVGNWFQRGTNGYAGVDRDRYWAGHLAVAYDLFDPSHVVVSIGTFDGASAQLGVRGSGPDPRDVSIESGVIVYELVDYDYYVDGERWDRVSLAKGIEARGLDGRIHGVVLFQLLDDRTLRVETFPGKTAPQVTGFTTSALIYER
ncbi:MAG: hypothetical protein IH850_01090 [Acidobacteria bacterium]|nr:hypothetical protein [Acidobacteriota bacterium]